VAERLFNTVACVSRPVRIVDIPRFALKLAVLCALWPVAPQAQATPVCRWVDQYGRTQIADVVPDRYQSVATCTESQQYELTAQQRLEAEQAAQDTGARAAASARARAASAPSRLRPPAAAARPIKKLPVEVVTKSTDCPTWWRLYDASIACFGPFRTTRGATRVEGFDACNVIASPEPTCGARVTRTE
jgi:hypothetical protein